MDDNDITTGDILGRAGFGFVRLSFATPRLFALQSLELDCFDNTDPQFLLNNAFQVCLLYTVSSIRIFLIVKSFTCIGNSIYLFFSYV